MVQVLAGWLTPGPSSPAFRLGWALQAGCTGVAVDDEHDGLSVAKPLRGFPDAVTASLATKLVTGSGNPTKPQLAYLVQVGHGCSHK